MKVKRNIAIILLIIFLIVLGILSIIFFKNLRTQNSETLIKSIHNMGEAVYSDYYYKIISVDKNQEQLSEFLSKFENMGLTFSLDELEKYSEDYKKTIDEYMDLNKECKKSQIMVIIYPKSPFSKSDFTSEVRDECVRTQ